MSVLYADSFGYLTNEISDYIPRGFNFDDTLVSRTDFVSHILFWAYKEVYAGNAKRESFAGHSGLRIGDDGYGRESRKNHLLILGNSVSFLIWC